MIVTNGFSEQFFVCTRFIRRDIIAVFLFWLKFANHSFFGTDTLIRLIFFQNAIITLIFEYTTKGYFSFIVRSSTKLDLFVSLFYSHGHWPFVKHNKRQLKRKVLFFLLEWETIFSVRNFFSGFFTHLHAI